MQTNKKTIAEEMFDSADAIHKVSRSGTLYGKLFAIKDIQIYLLKQEKLLEEELAEIERNNESKRL